MADTAMRIPRRLEGRAFSVAVGVASAARTTHVVPASHHDAVPANGIAVTAGDRMLRALSAGSA